MEAALCFAVIILGLVAAAAMTVVVLLMRWWPKDRHDFDAWVNAYNQGRSDGLDIGRQAGEAKARFDISAWNTQIPVPQKPPGAVDDQPVTNQETVGEWKMPAGTFPPAE